MPYSNKELEIELKTHRDYITPGQKENWEITVRASCGKLLTSNVLSSMYDASLDLFAEDTWGLNLYQNKDDIFNPDNYTCFSEYYKAMTKFFNLDNPVPFISARCWIMMNIDTKEVMYAKN